MSRSPQSGLSLIGVLVALFSLVIGTTAIAQMYAQNKHYSGTSRQRLLATSLAGEGIELAQAHISNSWLQNLGDWTGELCTLEGALAIDQDGPFRPDGEDGYSLYQNPDTGYFSHDHTGDETGLTRRLEVDCSLSGVAPDPDAGLYPNVSITSTVAWGEEGAAGHVSLTSVLYDWR